jgi:RNA-binding protein YlmH
MMSFLEHFRPEEHSFIERALDWMEQVTYQHRTRKTDFLDPRQLFILRSLIGKYADVAISAYGGFAVAERCRIILHPSYISPDPEEFGVCAFHVEAVAGAMTQVKHKDVLGSLLGIGLKRDKFGDILIHQNGIYLLAASEIAGYLSLHLQQINRYKVHLEEVSAENLPIVTQQWKEASLSVPSTRVDVVAGDIFRLSRSKILAPIRAGHLKVNWTTIESPSYLLKAGDIISLRGYGRFKIFEEEGITKKGKIRLVIGILL